jgi:hypothetical protein
LALSAWGFLFATRKDIPLLGQMLLTAPALKPDPETLWFAVKA